MSSNSIAFSSAVSSSLVWVYQSEFRNTAFMSVTLVLVFLMFLCVECCVLSQSKIWHLIEFDSTTRRASKSCNSSQHGPFTFHVLLARCVATALTLSLALRVDGGVYLPKVEGSSFFRSGASILVTVLACIFVSSAVLRQALHLVDRGGRLISVVRNTLCLASVMCGLAGLFLMFICVDASSLVPKFSISLDGSRDTVIRVAMGIACVVNMSRANHMKFAVSGSGRCREEPIVGVLWCKLIHVWVRIHRSISTLSRMLIVVLLAGFCMRVSVHEKPLIVYSSVEGVVGLSTGFTVSETVRLVCVASVVFYIVGSTLSTQVGDLRWKRCLAEVLCKLSTCFLSTIAVAFGYVDELFLVHVSILAFIQVLDLMISLINCVAAVGSAESRHESIQLGPEFRSLWVLTILVLIYCLASIYVSATTVAVFCLLSIGLHKLDCSSRSHEGRSSVVWHELLVSWSQGVFPRDRVTRAFASPYKSSPSLLVFAATKSAHGDDEAFMTGVHRSLWQGFMGSPDFWESLADGNRMTPGMCLVDQPDSLLCRVDMNDYSCSSPVSADLINFSIQASQRALWSLVSAGSVGFDMPEDFWKNLARMLTKVYANASGRAANPDPGDDDCEDPRASSCQHLADPREAIVHAVISCISERRKFMLLLPETKRTACSQTGRSVEPGRILSSGRAAKTIDVWWVWGDVGPLLFTVDSLRRSPKYAGATVRVLVYGLRRASDIAVVKARFDDWLVAHGLGTLVSDFVAARTPLRPKRKTERLNLHEPTVEPSHSTLGSSESVGVAEGMIEVSGERELKSHGRSKDNNGQDQENHTSGNAQSPNLTISGFGPTGPKPVPTGEKPGSRRKHVFFAETPDEPVYAPGETRAIHGGTRSHGDGLGNNLIDSLPTSDGKNQVASSHGQNLPESPRLRPDSSSDSLESALSSTPSFRRLGRAFTLSNLDSVSRDNSVASYRSESSPYRSESSPYRPESSSSLERGVDEQGSRPTTTTSPLRRGFSVLQRGMTFHEKPRASGPGFLTRLGNTMRGLAKTLDPNLVKAKFMEGSSPSTLPPSGLKPGRPTGLAERLDLDTIAMHSIMRKSTSDLSVSDQEPRSGSTGSPLDAKPNFPKKELPIQSSFANALLLDQLRQGMREVDIQRACEINATILKYSQKSDLILCTLMEIPRSATYSSYFEILSLMFREAPQTVLIKDFCQL